MKTLILSLALFSSQLLLSQSTELQYVDISSKQELETKVDSMESKALEFYHAISLADTSFLDYKNLLSPELLNSETESGIKLMKDSLSGKSWIQSQVVRAKSAENLFFILLYHPSKLEYYGRIQIIFKNDGDHLIDYWDFQ